MRPLVEDLKRVTPLKVGVGYALVSCVVLLLGQAVLPRAGAPEWAVSLIAVTLFIPFPFVVILTWALTAGPPENLKPVARRRRPELPGGPPKEG